MNANMKDSTTIKIKGASVKSVFVVVMPGTIIRILIVMLGIIWSESVRRLRGSVWVVCLIRRV